MTLYHNTHYGLRKARGSASDYPCSREGCTRQAREWAWDHTGESVTETIPSFGTMRTLRFSLNFERYHPLCKPCHVSLDLIQDVESFPCGHPRSDENTYRRPDGGTYCRVCHRDRERQRHRARSSRSHSGDSASVR